MAGKACVLTSRRLFYAMDELSKNTLIDLVVDRVRAELGEEACDDAVASVIQDWLSPICNLRGGRQHNLKDKMSAFDRIQERYKSQQAS